MAVPSIAGADPLPQTLPVLTPHPDGGWWVDWQGVENRIYFIQSSVDSVTWQFEPTMAFGADSWQCRIVTDSPETLVRLYYRDDSSIATLAEAEAKDSDTDGISNKDEIETTGTNPLLDDSDGDGLLDGWEYYMGLDPNDSTGINGAAGDADGDGLSNTEEHSLVTNPLDADSDADGIPDGEDAAPTTANHQAIYSAQAVTVWAPRE
jgi:hypothetical protein